MAEKIQPGIITVGCSRDAHGPEFNLNIAADERCTRHDLNITPRLYRCGELSLRS